jgi:acetyltransferase
MLGNEVLRVRLDDARLVTVRPIGASDLDALRTFFAALSSATLRHRFHSSFNELSEQLLRAFTMINPSAHVAFVAEIRDSTARKLRALVAEARFVRNPDLETAEFALVVADNWRRIGLGTLLTRTLAQRARFMGVRRLCGDVLPENEPMRGFANSLGARLSLGRGNVRTLRVSLELGDTCHPRDYVRADARRPAT